MIMTAPDDIQVGLPEGGGHEPAQRMEDLAQVIRAYNQVTEKLQASHESLKSEVHRLRTELASTNAQLQRSKRLSALGEMAAGIAHEIRNPLAAIHLYAKMVIDDLDAHEPDVCTAKANAGKIATAVRGLNAIVNDVLSFSRDLQPRPRSLRIDRVLSAAVEAQRPAIEGAGVSVVMDLPEDQPAAFFADADLIHQALVNLIRNAVEAMRDATRRVLTLAAAVEDDAVVLTVRDTGPGIAEADVDRIFNPFFTTRTTGTGLGLAIVHRIVDAHGGSVGVHHDHGAVFALMLPMAPAKGDGTESTCGQALVRVHG